MISRRFSMIAVILLLAATVSASQARSAEEYSLDPVHSSAMFKVGHLGIAFVRGTFTDIRGAIVVDTKNPSASSVEIIIRTESVNTWNEKRDEHLRSADFFEVAKFPEMSFKSKSVKKADGDTVEVTGDFTLHGVTKEITVKVTKTGEGDDPWGGHRIGFETAFDIRRSDYGMDKLIPMAGDKVHITLVTESIRQ